MRLNELSILNEASSLSALGVSGADVSTIHKTLNLKHDTEYEQVKSKGQMMTLAMDGGVGVAVNSGTGEVVAFAPNRRWSDRLRVARTGPAQKLDWHVLPKTDVSKIIAGRGWTYYIGKDYLPDYKPAPNEDAQRDFVKAVQKFDPVIKKRAMQAHKTIRTHIMDLLDSDEKLDNNTVMASSKNLNQLRDVMKALKRMAEDGAGAYFDGIAHYSKTGPYAALEDFFGTSGSYSLDNAVAEFQKDEKLALHKFAKFILNTIDKHVEIYTTGNWANTDPKNAQDYRDAR